MDIINYCISLNNLRAHYDDRCYQIGQCKLYFNASMTNMSLNIISNP